MHGHDYDFVWVLVIAASALTGWWLAVRPGASFRGAAASMSCLILIMAVLMCFLAIHGQGSATRKAQATIGRDFAKGQHVALQRK